MITSFKHKGLFKYWSKGDSSKIPSEMVSRITRILDILNAVTEVPQDFEPFKNYRLHPLKGDLKGYWSIDVTGNWRILFKFDNGNAYDIDLRYSLKIKN